MEIITVLRANIRYQKGSFFSILVLMLMVSLSLTSVLTVSINSEKSEWEALERAGFGTLLAALYDQEPDKMEHLIQDTKANKHVEKVEQTQVVYGGIEHGDGKDFSNDIILESEGTFDFQIYDRSGTGYERQPQKLKQKEVAVPISYTTLYDYKIGDKVKIKSQRGQLEYTIKYFFEDPFMGSSTMGVKTILMQQEELNTLREQAKQRENTELKAGTLLNIFQNPNSKQSYMEFSRELNLETGILGYTWVGMGTTQAVGYMLILTNIFSGILLLFIILLLLITLIIMSHNISSSMEMEYVNLGILKAVGFTQGKLRWILTLQYLLGSAVGAVLGIPLSVPVVNLINRIVIPVIGIRISGRMPLNICLIAEFIILAIILLFVNLKLRELRKVTPVRAICQGRESVYFSNPLELPIKNRGLSFWLAFRQMTAGGKQYVVAGIVTALLVFFLIVMGNASAVMGEDGEGFAQMFEVTEQDLEIYYNDPDIRQKAEQKIEEFAKIERKFELFSMYLLLDGCRCYCRITDNPEEYYMILEGRTCRYDNEILITEFVAKDLGLDIGDTVEVSFQEDRAEFLVSGIYQSASDMGINFALSQKGYLRLRELNELPEELAVAQMYGLAKGDDTERIAEMLNQEYGEKIQVSITGEGYPGAASSAAAVRAITALAYVLAIIFVLIVIFLVCSKVFAKEQQDYGIYKAIGFTSRQLRLQFALRFLLVSVVGSLIGVIFGICLNHFCITSVLSLVGVSHVEMEITFLSVIFPVLVMAFSFFLFSWILSIRMKKVKPRILIAEN